MVSVGNLDRFTDFMLISVDYVVNAGNLARFVEFVIYRIC